MQKSVALLSRIWRPIPDSEGGGSPPDPLGGFHGPTCAVVTGAGGGPEPPMFGTVGGALGAGGATCCWVRVIQDVSRSSNGA